MEEVAAARAAGKEGCGRRGRGEASMSCPEQRGAAARVGAPGGSACGRRRLQGDGRGDAAAAAQVRPGGGCGDAGALRPGGVARGGRQVGGQAGSRAGGRGDVLGVTSSLSDH
eukprot:6732839-Prymnesium_polylepis.2